MLEDSTYQSKPINSLILTHNKIRELAYQKNNKLLLHSDPHLRNYLYEKESNKTIAIDPAIKIKDQLSLKEADAKLNLFTVHSINKLETNLSEVYIKDFVSSLDKDVKIMMVNSNKKLSNFVKKYFRTRNRVGNLLSKEKLQCAVNDYSDEKIDRLNDLILSN